MLVKELIELLSQQDPEAIVSIEHDDLLDEQVGMSFEQVPNGVHSIDLFQMVYIETETKPVY